MRRVLIQVLPGLFLTILFLFIWFHKALMIGATESEIPFYNVGVHLYKYSHVWSPVGFGFAPGFPLSSILFNHFQLLLLSFHIPGYLAQAFVFGILLFFPFSSILLFQIYFEKNGKIIALFAAIFYTCNLLSLGSVWNRLQYPYMFFYASLPLLIFLFLKGLTTKKMIYALFINIVAAIFVMGISSIATIELYWLILLTILIFFVLLNREDKIIVQRAFLFFILTFILWILFNSWWLLQTIKVVANPYTLTQQYAASDDIDTFVNVSQELGNVSYILRLMNVGMFMQMQKVWGSIYFSPAMIIISYIIPFLAFVPLALKNKPKILHLFLGIALLLIFFMKGSSGIFGGIFLFLFSNVRLLEAFRDPFEKISFGLPFFYAPLIGYSLFMTYLFLNRKLSTKIAQIVTGVLTILLFVVLVFPMWNTWVFTNTFIPTNNTNIGYYVKVPSYYAAANNWLNLDHTDFRVIALPMTQRGDGITQNWEYGYNGTEASNDYLFDKPFISFSNSTQFEGNIAGQLEYSLFRSPENFSTLMSVLDSRYVMVRSDINFKDRNMKNPTLINNYLKKTKIPNISFSKNFNELTFYRNEDDIHKLYVANNLYSTSINNILTDSFFLTGFKIGDAIINDEGTNHVGKLYVSDTLINPSTVFEYSQYHFSQDAIDSAKAELPHSRFLPDSLLYPLIRFKEELSLKFQNNNNEILLTYFLLSQKRLGELERVASSNVNTFTIAVNNYMQSLQDISNFIDKGNEQTVTNNSPKVREIIMEERIILDELVKKNKSSFSSSLLAKATSTLYKLSVKTNMMPLFSPLSDNTNNLQIYNFINLPSNYYDVFLKNDDLEKYYLLPNGALSLQINNILLTSSLTQQNNNWIHIGKFNLQKGNSEVQIQPLKARNLLSQSDNPISGTLSSSQNTTATKNFTINNFDPYATYIISLSYKFLKGSEFSLQVDTDVDSVDKDGTKPDWVVTVSAGNSNKGWRNISFEYSPVASANDAKLALLVRPFNNCYQANGNFFHNLICKDKNTYKKYNKSTTIAFNNLKVERKFTNQIILRSSNTTTETPQPTPQITYVKTNPSEYIVSIKNATKPFVLIFSESFNPFWKALFINNKQISEKNHFLVNSYANAWYMTKTGNYTVTLRFTPEDYYDFGKLVTIISLVISLGWLIHYMFHNS